MFSLVPVIADRLAAALGAGWDVSDGAKPQDRRRLPRAEVRLDGAVLAGTSGPGVTLKLGYVVQLCVQRSSPAFAQLDEAVTAVIASAHHWAPTGHAARLQLQGFTEIDFAEQELFGYSLTFALTATRKGCNE